MSAAGTGRMGDFEAGRRRMVDNQLRTAGITDRRVLTAMESVPRERFVPEARVPLAYADVTHDLGGGRSLASPGAFAKLIQLAEIEHTDRVLDVGTGLGYSAAVLAKIGASVLAIESDERLVTAARAAVAGMGPIEVVRASLDDPGQFGTFDVIVLEGSVEEVPQALFHLLADRGRLVAVISGRGAPVAMVFVRSGDDIAARSDFNTAFPQLDAKARSEAFVF